MKSTGAWSSNELQWLDLKIGHQESSPSNGHQDDMPDSYLVARWRESAWQWSGQHPGSPSPPASRITSAQYSYVQGCGRSEHRRSTWKNSPHLVSQMSRLTSDPAFSLQPEERTRHDEEITMISVNWWGLTHCGLVIPYGNIDLGQHWLR